MINCCSLLCNKTLLLKTHYHVHLHMHSNPQHKMKKQIYFWKSSSSGWMAAWCILQVFQLYVQRANNSKLNNVSLITIPQCWLYVDSHHTVNSPAPLLHSSVLASLARLGCTVIHSNIWYWFTFLPPFHKAFFTHADMIWQEIIS